MASIDFIQKRIAGKEKEIDKLEKKLARIWRAKESNWENNPYFYDERDLIWTRQDLEAARQGLAKYQAELEAALEKANSRNVPAILEFLEIWKQRCTEFYGNGLASYFDENSTYGTCIAPSPIPNTEALSTRPQKPPTTKRTPLFAARCGATMKPSPIRIAGENPARANRRCAKASMST